MHIAICEDDVDMLASLESIVCKWAERKRIRPIIKKFHSAEEFLMYWPASHPYDLLILDVALGGMSGIELSNIVRETDSLVEIIFASGSMEHAGGGFLTGAIRYLHKPFTTAECHEALDAAYNRNVQTRDYGIVLNTNDEVRRVPVNQIMHMTTAPIKHEVVKFSWSTENLRIERL